MANTQPTAYDEVPYTDQIFYYSHPDRLATMGRLLGMQPAPPERCRVLELGCGTGANLIRMAPGLPGSAFVGIDLSPRQIEMGHAVAGRLGLTNLDLRSGSILDLDERLGRFDYIICHGVYSWVPAEVQDKILALCGQLLAPAGIAYVSYNTYPGWHRRNMIREMMRFHVRQFDDPAERVEQARAMLDFLIDCVGDAKGHYAAMLQAEADMLNNAADSYIYHEHLEENNTPVYFHEFAARAAAHGLQYLAEAQPTPLPSNLSPKARGILERVAVDLIQGEQYLDFVRNRTFRRTLLVRADVALRRPPAAQAVTQLHVASPLRPGAEKPDLRASARETFSTDEDARLSTNNPLLKAALVCLWEEWPGTVPFAELWRRAQRRLAAEAPGEAEGADEQVLAEPLLQCFLANLVELCATPSQFARQASARPRACPLASLFAEQGGRIPNLRHRTVFLSDFERQVLRLLDGRRTAADVVAVMLDAVHSGDLKIQRDGAAPLPVDQARGVVEEAVPSTIARLARLAVLVE